MSPLSFCAGHLGAYCTSQVAKGGGIEYLDGYYLLSMMERYFSSSQVHWNNAARTSRDGRVTYYHQSSCRAGSPGSRGIPVGAGADQQQDGIAKTTVNALQRRLLNALRRNIRI